MPSEYRIRVAAWEERDEDQRLDEAKMIAKAGSNQAKRGSPRFYAWNRVIHALWAIESLTTKGETDDG